MAVITTSGALATLLLGFAALSAKGTGFTLSGASKWLVVAALVLFTVSAAFALATNWPLVYQAVTISEMRARLDENPRRDADAAAEDVAYSRLAELGSAKQKNTLKGTLLIWALSFEVAAVACVGVAVGLTLL